jgi:hypothetical protein
MQQPALASARPCFCFEFDDRLSMQLLQYLVVVEGDADGVYPPREFFDFLEAVDYGIQVLTTWEGVTGSPGLHITGHGEKYDDQLWTLERLRAVRAVVDHARPNSHSIETKG